MKFRAPFSNPNYTFVSKGWWAKRHRGPRPRAAPYGHRIDMPLLQDRNTLDSNKAFWRASTRRSLSSQITAATINEHDELGMTPLMWAAAYVEDPAIIDLLLERGADAKAKTKHGVTALHWAGHYNKSERVVEVVQALLVGGADPAAKAKNGLTPAEFALDNGTPLGGSRRLLHALATRPRPAVAAGSLGAAPPASASSRSVSRRGVLGLCTQATLRWRSCSTNLAAATDDSAPAASKGSSEMCHSKPSGRPRPAAPPPPPYRRHWPAGSCVHEGCCPNRKASVREPSLSLVPLRRGSWTRTCFPTTRFDNDSSSTLLACPIYCAHSECER